MVWRLTPKEIQASKEKPILIILTDQNSHRLQLFRNLSNTDLLLCMQFNKCEGCCGARSLFSPPAPLCACAPHVVPEALEMQGGEKTIRTAFCWCLWRESIEMNAESATSGVVPPMPPRYRLRDLILGDVAFTDDGQRWVLHLRIILRAPAPPEQTSKQRVTI